MDRLMMLFVTVLLVAFSVAAFGESAGVSTSANRNPVRVQRAGGQQSETLPRVDGDQAYKANCLRCHAEPRKFSKREMVTIMRHMRVRANLTEEETGSILQYLTR